MMIEWTEEDRERICQMQHHGSYCARRFSGETGKFYTVHSSNCNGVFEKIKLLVEEANERTEL